MRAVIDSLFPPDPGSLRLIAAARATLAGVLTILLVLLLGRVADVPVTDRVLGFAIAMFLAAMARDATTRGKLTTVAMAALAAGATTTLGSLLVDLPRMAAVVMPPLVFLVVSYAARGPRYATIGTAALVAYIVALVAKQPAETIPVRWLILLVAAGNAAFVCGVLMPESGHADRARLRRAIHQRVGGIAELIASAVTAGRWEPESAAALRRQVHLLGEEVMLAQSRLPAVADRAAGGGDRWLDLLAIRLAAERVARVAEQDLGAPADRATLLKQLAVLRGGAAAQAEPAADQAADTPLAAVLCALQHSLAQPGGKQPDVAASASPVVAAPGWRPGLQAALATALAIAVSEWLLPDRWYWAAFAALVMFQGTRSRGESLAKGLAFIAGTSAGLVAGVLLATLLSDNHVVSVAAVLIAVFFAFQANVAAYGVMVFWITIILGLVFGMLGYFTPAVLELRLGEAVVGVACGALVASLILVRQDRTVAHRATTDFLQALGRLVDRAAAVLLNGSSSADLPALLTAAEQRFAELHTIAQQSMFQSPRDSELRQRLLLLEACDDWARELGAIALTGGRITKPGLAASARRAASGVATSISRFDQPDPTHAGAARSGNDAVAPVEDPQTQATRLLLRLDATLASFQREPAAAGAATT